MKKQEIMNTIRAHSQKLQNMGAVSPYLFGSIVRDATGPDSDVDLFLDHDPAQNSNLVWLLKIREYLSDILNKTDLTTLTTRNFLLPLLKDKIIQSSGRVF